MAALDLSDVRARLDRSMSRRWTRMAREVKRAIVMHDALGLGPKSPTMVMPADHKADLFRRWLDERLMAGVIGRDAGWLKPFVDTASSRAMRQGLADFDPDEPRDDKGKWTAGHGGQRFNRAAAERGMTAVSPSTTDTDFAGAIKGLAGEKQAKFEQASAEIDKGLGIEGAKSVGVIGAWQDGAENALVTTTAHTSWDQLETSAAMKAHLANQKAALVFHSDPDGHAVLYTMHAKGDAGSIHAGLLADGVAFHSIEPDADGHGATIHIADLDGSAYDSVAKSAERFNAKVDFATGRAAFIGSDGSEGSDAEQRAGARRAYEKIISESKVSGAADVWRRVHSGWGADGGSTGESSSGWAEGSSALSDGVDDEPRDDRGRWTEGSRRAFLIPTFVHGGKVYRAKGAEAHADILASLPADEHAKLLAEWVKNPSIVRFTTPSGAILNRSDAFDYAEQNGLLKEATGYESRELITEFLKPGATKPRITDAQSNLGFIGQEAAPSAGVCHAASISALATICDDVSQRARSHVSAGLLLAKRPAQIARLLDQAFGEGLKRSRMLAEHAVTMSYSQATLDAMQLRGVTHVGTISEHSHPLTDYDEGEARNERGEWTSSTQKFLLGEVHHNAVLARVKAIARESRYHEAKITVDKDSGQIDAASGDTFNHDEIASGLRFVHGFVIHDPKANKFGYFLTEHHPIEDRLQRSGIEDWSGRPEYAVRDYDPGEGRDPHGRWTGGNGDWAKLSSEDKAGLTKRLVPAVRHIASGELTVGRRGDTHRDLGFYVENTEDVERGFVDPQSKKFWSGADVPLDSADLMSSRQRVGMFGHDAGPDDEPRDGQGRWTAGGGIVAYHGSPHDFSKFDLSHLGSGEGEQMFGHGIYLADVPEVAKSYSRGAAGSTKGGNLYAVNIHAKPEEFFDWDAPLSAQNQKVKNWVSARAAAGHNVPDWDAPGSWALVADRGEGKGSLEKSLLASGLPGIRYLDEKSRAAGGSRNYVVFDPSILEITHKNGVALKDYDPSEGRDPPAQFTPTLKTFDLSDAARQTPQPQHPKTGQFAKAHIVAREKRRSKKTGQFRRQGLSPDEQRKEELTEARFNRVAGELDVLTQQDDKVCRKCEEISQSGPYSINEARSLIPAHPNCRCLFVAAGTMRDAANRPYHTASGRTDETVTDRSFRDYNPDEPRDQDGKWASGGGGDVEAERAMMAIPDTHTINTPERQALRQSVEDRLYNKGVDHRSRNRQATIILGLPAAGKSTIAHPLVKNGALEIDPDSAKELLPEYKGGIGAYALHEESSMITRKLLQRALANGDDIVWPRIDSKDKIVADVGSLKKAGYDVHLRFVDIDQGDALKAAHQRFLATGRYVSPKVIQGFGDSPRQAYQGALATGMIASHETYHRSLTAGLAKVDDAVTGDDEWAKRYRARLDESEARDTEALADFVAENYLTDFSPDEPRDETGKWTALQGSQGHGALISTANPTAKKSAGESGNYQRVDIKAMQRDPDMFKTNVDLFKNGDFYPGMRPDEVHGGPHDVVEAVKNRMVENLTFLANKVKQDDAANGTDNFKKWGGWYEGAHNIAEANAKKFGTDIPSASGTIAALSPQNDWNTNVYQAGVVSDALKNKLGAKWDAKMSATSQAIWSGQRLAMAKEIEGKTLGELTKPLAGDSPEDGAGLALARQAMWIRTENEAHSDRSFHEVQTDGSLGKMMTTQTGKPSTAAWKQVSAIANAVAAFHSDGDGATLSGAMGARHKVRSFFNNILDPHSKNGDVTVDTHAVGAAWLTPSTTSDVSVAHALASTMMRKDQPKGYKGTASSAVTGVSGTYAVYADAYREAAAQLHVEPRQLQSIVWEAKQRLFSKAQTGPKVKTAVDAVWRRFHNGEIGLKVAQREVVKAAEGSVG